MRSGCQWPLTSAYSMPALYGCRSTVLCRWEIRFNRVSAFKAAPFVTVRASWYTSIISHSLSLSFTIPLALSLYPHWNLKMIYCISLCPGIFTTITTGHCFIAGICCWLKENTVKWMSWLGLSWCTSSSAGFPLCNNMTHPVYPCCFSSPLQLRQQSFICYITACLADLKTDTLTEF